MASTEAKERKKKRAQRRAERAARRNGTASTNGKATAAKPKGKVREWFDALLFAVIVMLIVRTLIFDLFRIPTPSMEKSLLVGDYLFVSKIHYGTRLPMGICVPFTEICLPGVTFPYTRVPGFTEVKRGEAIVFNWPAEEKPISQKMHYIKRVVGMPGETLEVRDKVVHINGEPQPLLPGMQQQWYVYKKDQRVRLSNARLTALGVDEVLPTANPSILRIVATEGAVEEIRAWPYVDRVDPAIAPADAGYSSIMYPPNLGYTPDNYGPMTIPKEGETVTLTPENWRYLEPVIRRFEGHTTQALQDGTFQIDGQPATTYTFTQDYFFAMGDNRDNSEDSRFWGFVPMTHVVGKAVLIYFSWSAEDNLPRFNRIFHFVE